MKRSSLICYFILLIFIFINGCVTRTEEVIRDKYPSGAPKIVDVYKIERGIKTLIKQTAYYENKKIQGGGNIKNNKMDGKWTYYYPNGNKWSEGYFKEGKEEGTRTAWYENGNKRFEGLFKDGKRMGKWTFWDENGKVEKEIDYNK